MNFAEGVARANDLAAAVDADDSEVERNIEIQQRVEGQPAAYVNHAMEDWIRLNFFFFWFFFWIFKTLITFIFVLVFQSLLIVWLGYQLYDLIHIRT